MRTLTRAGSGRRWARGGRTVPLLVPMILIAWLTGVYLLVRVTGGTPNPLVHLAYVGIAVAAMTGGWRPGLAMGAAAGLLMGPVDAGLHARWRNPRGPVGLASPVSRVRHGRRRDRDLLGAVDADHRRTSRNRRAPPGSWPGRGQRAVDMHQLVETSPLGIILFDGGNSITTVNPGSRYPPWVIGG